MLTETRVKQLVSRERRIVESAGSQRTLCARGEEDDMVEVALVELDQLRTLLLGTLERDLVASLCMTQGSGFSVLNEPSKSEEEDVPSRSAQKCEKLARSMPFSTATSTREPVDETA